MNRRDFIHKQAAEWLLEMQAAWELVKDNGLDYESFWSSGNPYFVRVSRLYEEDFQLAKMGDQSDLIVHAEGPGAAHESPSLQTVNWLGTRMEKQLRALVEAVVPMVADAAKLASRSLDLHLTGLAPGSLYMGFAVAAPASSLPGMEECDADMLEKVKKALHSLTLVAQHVTETRMGEAIAEALPDAALRDAAIVAAYAMTPTGYKGIDSVELSAPRADIAASTLSRSDRVALKECIRRPIMRTTAEGSLVGDLRMLDLDLNRAILRHVKGNNSVRCVLEVAPSSVQRYFGQTVRVHGEYESSQDGRPRLIKVRKIEHLQHKLAIDE